MRCPRCQHENPPQAKFCLECGTRLAQTCAQCGTELPASAKFCLECGQPVGSPAAPGRFASPDAYTPKHLAERILTSKSALEGERKLVTVLFADLKGSMELLADRDPEEARTLLDPVLERMMEAVHRYEGTVNQVMGDGIMALFGAPVAHEDHAVRACYAALDMQRAIRRYAEEVRRTHGVGLRARAGLNSGGVVVRAIGGDLRMDYSAIGQTVHLAARMEQLATPGSTLLTAETLRLAEDWVEVRPLGPVPVKGLEAPIEVYEMTGAGPRKSRLHAAAARGLTRFVGRDTELEQLRHALGQAASGHGQVVAVVGEAGVGKSRLVWEVTHSHRTHGWRILESHSVSYGKATPHLPVIDLLKGYFGIQDRDEPRVVREKVTGKLLTLDRALESTLPAFLSLLDVLVEDVQWQALDPPQRRQRMLDALKRLLLRESQVQPLLVVFEDLHWIDSETQAFLDGLVESVPTARLLVLVTYRPEYQHAWASKTYYTRLRLDPLPPESAEALLRGLLGPGPSLASLTPLLIERTGGNPFFLEECIRTLVEAKVLVGPAGAYRLDVSLPSIQVPVTVQAVLAARIDRLPPDEKRLLQAAAVIGKDVPFALLAAVAELPDNDLRGGLGHLQAAEFLYETRLFPDPEYTFKHALTHEVAYGSVLRERRIVLHARIVDAIERLSGNRLPEHVDRLAHHAALGEEWNKAAKYLRESAAKAATRSAHVEAARCLERVLDVLPQLGDTTDTREQGIDVRFELRRSLFPLAQLDRVATYLDEAETYALQLGDQRRLARALDYLCHYFWITGDYRRAVEYGHRAFKIAGGLGDVPLQASAHHHVGQAHHARGAWHLALDHLDRANAVLGGDLMRGTLGMVGPISVFSRTWAALCHAETGAFPKATAEANEALRLAENAGDLYSLFHGFFALGTVYLAKGEEGEAIPALERAMSLAQTGSLRVMFAFAAAHLGHACTLFGRVGDARHLLQEAVGVGASNQIRAEHSRWVAWLSETFLSLGERERAIKLAAEALGLARQRSEPGKEALALCVLGQIASRRDPPDAEAAETHYRQALTLATRLGMRPLVAHCHLGLGRLYGRTRPREQAQKHLGTAMAMYREMGMDFWLEKAKAELELPERGSP